MISPEHTSPITHNFLNGCDVPTFSQTTQEMRSELDEEFYPVFGDLCGERFGDCMESPRTVQNGRPRVVCKSGSSMIINDHSVEMSGRPVEPGSLMYCNARR